MILAIYSTPYYLEGWEIYAEHFRSLPEVERFYSVFPDAHPKRTSAYIDSVEYATNYGPDKNTVGYGVNDGDAWIEMIIFHDRFSFEPNDIIVRCIGTGYVISDEIMDHMKTMYCGKGYPDGFEPYTDVFAELDDVRAFLESYPDAQPGFVYVFPHGYAPGFAATDGDNSVELAVLHEPGSFEPVRLQVTCGNDQSGYNTKYSTEYSTIEPFLTKPYCE
ncbi:MAG: hypothetical protein EB830_03320 [Nitrosopumilus sp. H13]|nr:MAG: hypothetical protein EB830_03320 [Nitrosopumilus sp. H13]